MSVRCSVKRLVSIFGKLYLLSYHQFIILRLVNLTEFYGFL